jgi:outer membrane protein OmpA-like peptidoglycan-associated protein
VTKNIGKLPAFEPPVNAATVNSPEEEMTPSFFGPTQQLWFSSDGLGGLGGFDIFSAHKDSIELSKPNNAGPKLNTSYNDLYFFLKKDGKNGFLSSNRPGSFFLDESNKSCCNDIFTFKLPDPPAPNPSPATPDTIALVQRVKSPLNEVIPIPKPLPAPPKLADFVGLPLYFENDEPDKRTRRNTTQKTYEETAQAYLAAQPLYRQRFAAGLDDNGSEAAEAQVDQFFENEVRQGYDRLSQLCDLLHVRLRGGERIEVVIKGFTSPRAQTDYNLNLAKRRINSVLNQFETWQDGALGAYITSGQLIITEAGMGETLVREGVSDDLKDERNSVYHPAAARERRVEIIEIREK